jgi:hypothetical protein
MNFQHTNEHTELKCATLRMYQLRSPDEKRRFMLDEWMHWLQDDAANLIGDGIRMPGPCHDQELHYRKNRTFHRP